MRAFIAFAIALASACGVPPREQVLLFFDTDAPLPSRVPKHVDALAPIPLFDRLRIEVFPPGATQPCTGCRNEFEIDVELFASQKASIGVPIPAGASGWRARARMFVAAYVDPSGEPSPGSTVEVWVALPAIAKDTVVSATVMLPTDAVGLASDPSTPSAPVLGPPPSSKVGSWAPSVRAACTSPVEGAVCIPNGAFWMGNKSADGTEGHAPTWHRLVTVGAFAMDAQEVTVDRFRRFGGNTPPWNGSTAGGSIQDWCTFSKSATPRDVLPVNCVAWRTARNWCLARGGDLPTEAQYEIVATRWGRSMFAWGNDIPSCTDAVWGRAGFGIYTSIVSKTCRSSSMALGEMGGPEIAGTGTLDAIDGADGTLLDLTANVSEWMRDRFADENEPCWTGRILDSPTCDVAGPMDPVVARGGAWNNDVPTMRGDRRFAGAQTDLDAAIGFRCVYSLQ